MRIASLVLGIVLSTSAVAEQAAISIDGRFDDWADIQPIYVDAIGDSTSPTGFDFGRLWIADDDEYLYLRYETTAVVDPSGPSNFTLLAIDIDNDPNTGLAAYGMGVELLWRFGPRSGQLFNAAGNPQAIKHPAIGLVGLPTVDANDFEFAISRDPFPSAPEPLFPYGTIRLALVTSNNSDHLPGLNESIEYTFDVGGPIEPPPPIPLANPLPQGTQRLLTFNVLRDAPWKPRNQGLGRIVAAAAADIMCFQEIYRHSASQTASWVSSWHPNNPAGGWHTAKWTDCVTVSRWPILKWWRVGAELATVIEISAGDQSRNLLVINAHLSCCDNDSARQSEIDQILGFIRDQRNDPEEPLITPDTPIVITGDLNLVGFAQQLDSLLTGDIINEAAYGPDFAIDNDGSEAEFVYTRHTHTRFYYTWRDDLLDFWPGRLDYLISTDSTYAPFHSYAIETRTMAPDALVANGLQVADSSRSDHLALVADFGFSSGRGDLNQDGFVDGLDISNFIAAMLKPASFTAANPLTPIAAADINSDGQIDALDISPFVRCVIYDGCD